MQVIAAECLPGCGYGHRPMRAAPSPLMGEGRGEGELGLLCGHDSIGLVTGVSE